MLSALKSYKIRPGKKTTLHKLTGSLNEKSHLFYPENLHEYKEPPPRGRIMRTQGELAQENDRVTDEGRRAGTV
jgi:hypothetical protein